VRRRAAPMITAEPPRRERGVAEALAARVRQQEAIADFGLRALRDGDLTALYQASAETAMAGLDADYASVLELRPDGQLQLVAGSGWTFALDPGEPIVTSADARSPAGLSLLANGAVCAVPEDAESLAYQESLLGMHGVHSSAATVITAGATPFGVLSAHSTRENAFAEDDLHFLRSLAALLAGAIARSSAESAARQLAAIVTSSADAIIGKTLDGAITSWNPAAERIYGYRAEEVVGRSVRMLQPPDGADDVSAILLRVRHGERVEGYRTSRVRKDGRRIDVSLTVSPIRDAAGTVVGAATIARDITAELEAERAVRRLAAIVEHTRDAIVGRTPDGIVTSWNRGAERLFGYAAEEMIGRPIQILAPEGYVEEFDRIRDSISRGETLELETVRRRKDGSLIEISSTVSPIVDGAGRVVSIAAISRDVGERRRAEQALRTSEQRYRDLFEKANDLIATADLDGRLTSVNTAFASVLGYAREELVGRLLSELVPPEWHEEIDRALDRKLDSEVSTTVYEHELIAKDGRRISVEVASRLIEAGGRAIGTQAICRNVSERKAAERSLRAAEQRYRSLVERLPLVTFVEAIDPGRARSYVSPQIESLLGYTPEEWLADPELFWRLVDPAGADALRAAAAGGPPCHEFRLRARDGREVWVHGERQTVADESGRPLYAQGFWLDITEQRRSEEALRESRELYRLVVESSTDLIALLDLEGRVVYGSPSHAAILGYEAYEVLSLRGPAMVHPDDAERADSAFAAAAAGAAACPSGPIRLRRKDGAYVSIDSRMNPIVGPDGETQLILATGQDVTDRERAAELSGQLRQAQKMDAIGRLAGGVAHDFNNLLTVILGYSEIGLARRDVDQVHSAIGQVVTAAQSAAALTRQLLAFSRQQVLRPRRLDLGEVIHSTEGLLTRVLGEDVALGVSVDPGLPQVEVDPHQIEQVLLNLAVNAREAMPDGGALVIEAVAVVADETYASVHLGVEPGLYVELAVSDSGVGMDEATRTRIFEPFFTTKTEGTGLGLATVHGIVTQSGGQVQVYSEPGAGTTFKLLFPAAGLDAELAAADGAVEGELRGTGTILLVEDEDAVRGLAAELLERLGYTVLTAASPAEARAVAGECDRPIDLILSDVMLPGGTGPEIVEELKALHPHAKTLYTSGYARVLVSERGVDPGEPFLAKPFTTAGLAARVREVLEG